MHVISRKIFKVFSKKHPDSQNPLLSWYKIVSKTDFKNLADLKATLPATDKVGDLYVFNIVGNKYRLIASIHFNRKKVYIRDILTHSEYDRGAWKQ